VTNRSVPAALVLLALAGTALAQPTTPTTPRTPTPTAASARPGAAVATPRATTTTPAGRAAAGQPEAERPNDRLLSDFIFYVNIDNRDLAEAYGQELLTRGLSNAEVVALVEAGEASRFQGAITRAIRVRQLEPIAASLNRAYDAGVLERARNPDQIARNITELTGTARGRGLARARLVAAGEYAMPQVLEAFLNPPRPALRPELQRVMIELGRQAISPLAAALLSTPPAQQELIADMLGQIPYRTSKPFLADVMARTESEPVRIASARALDRLGGEGGMPQDLYRNLAEAYYAEKSEVTSFPGEEFQLLWGFTPQAGLTMTAIRTPVYHEAVAMGLAERAMGIESATGGASLETLALWVASNFSREIDTPAGYVNPAYPLEGGAGGAQARRRAMYYAVASGADVSQRVLARAIDARDTPLARLALASVEQTAGGRAVGLAAAGGRNPLLEALTYPSRRVQYEAALALAASNPGEAFPGAERVVPTLASAVSGAATQYAAVIAGDAEAYQSARRTLTTLGYTVLPQGRTLNDLATPIAEAPAIDLIVVAGTNGERAPAQVEEVRGQAKLAATPVLILTDAVSLPEVRRRYSTDATVSVRQVGLPEEQLMAATMDLVTGASGGPVSAAEGQQYSARALAALRDLAVSQSTVLSAADATLPLAAALEAGSAPRLQVAEILSRVNGERAQRAVMDAALAAEGAERIQLMRLVSDSAKRFGNLLEPRQTTRLIELASSGADEEATSAASLMGALSLPNADLVPLILRK